MNQAKPKQSGFTIIELMLAVVIIGILAGIALPSFNYVIANNRMSSTANNVVGAFNLARVEAAQRGTDVRIGSVSGTTNWGSQGFRIWLDADDDNTFDAGEELRVFEPVATGLTLNTVGALTFTTFNAVGFSINSAAATRPPQSLTLRLCSSEASVSDRQLDISASGRVSVTQVACP